jgi:glycosyltransferase involved in cell wall biosynthesis
MKEVSTVVSVIITTYKRADYLEEAIVSVANQTYKSIEIIVVDDGSIVNYAKTICSKYKNCTYYYKENGGLSSARNFGISKAKGKYIAFLDDDDRWVLNKLEKQVQVLDEMNDIDCVHSSALVIDANGMETGEIIGASKEKAHKRSGNVFWNALGVWVVKSPTPLIRKIVFQPDLLFDETIKVGEDIDFYQRMFYRHKVYYIDTPLAYYRDYNHQNRLSVQTKKYIGIEKKMYQNFKKMGVRNFFTLYKIAIRLATSSLRTYNEVSKTRKIKLNIYILYLYPHYYIKKASKI